MLIDLKEKVILVTGASRGIGKAIATALGKSGATVAVHGNSNLEAATDLATSIGNRSKAFAADLSNERQVSDLFAEVLKTYGKVDVLINNAGIAISSDIKLDNEQWVNDWNKTMAVNLTATALLCKEAIGQFEKSGGGIIINISSRAAFRGDTQDYFAYAASKGGVVALTKSIARAYGKQNITAYSVAPGFTKTEMAQDFIDAYGEDFATKDLSLAELTQPEDIAPMVVFLASGKAKHATGTTIDMNAGSYVR
ncbi:SDR family oxidoreductase [Fulvivirga sp. RKSG066]|uniref:SDR family NAD(P)-dependent oxidoreductase n=1 Tax=Fulvivirga aurantia TaxID=2529383 RepID=UPI0012BCBD62|nr:SDR family oxidoreductase [Fulvivirga aurantia]MTI21783.1 SDR family oxidoreductase [Fulvivirga aurantia]